MELHKEAPEISLDKILQVCIQKGQRVSKSEIVGLESEENMAEGSST